MLCQLSTKRAAAGASRASFLSATRFPAPKPRNQRPRAAPAAGSHPAVPRAAAPAAAADRSSSPSSSRGSKSDTSTDDWRQLLLDAVAQQPEQLVKLTLKARITAAPEQQLSNVSNAASTQAPGAAAAAAAAAAGVMPYKLLTLRPVLLKGRRQLQLQLLDARQDTTKNYSDAAAAEQLQLLLRLPWHHATLVTLQQTVTVQVSRKGRVLLQTAKNKQAAGQISIPDRPAAAAGSTERQGGLAPVSALGGPLQALQLPGEAAGAGIPLSLLQHDRVKPQPINGAVPDPFLQRIGLQTADGRIKANMQAKFTQINEFLKLLIHTGELEQLGRPAAHTDTDTSGSSSSDGSSGSSSSSDGRSGGSAVHILDAGCGSSHLTLGCYHFLSNIRGLPVRLTGIDTNRALMERSNTFATQLGIADFASFVTSSIRDFQPSCAPDIVLALHACDTATDEALALGVASGAAIIMSVPCCHKDIHRQQQQQGRKGGGGGIDDAGRLDLLLGHGIMRQRLLDLLTDTFRASLLRLAGYRTDVVEFVSTEHTPRNLLIRAVKQRRPLDQAARAKLARDYTDLRDCWGVTPRLEVLLREAGLDVLAG